MKKFNNRPSCEVTQLWTIKAERGLEEMGRSPVGLSVGRSLLLLPSRLSTGRNLRDLYRFIDGRTDIGEVTTAPGKEREREGRRGKCAFQPGIAAAVAVLLSEQMPFRLPLSLLFSPMQRL